MNGGLASHQAEIEDFCRCFGVRSLELSGSAAHGEDRTPASDLDFLVEFQPEPPDGYADAYRGLPEALLDLFGRSVNLVVASATRNTVFRESVERTTVLLYAA